MNRLLAKTNSWHWLTAALLISGLLSWGTVFFYAGPATERAEASVAALQGTLDGYASLMPARIDAARQQQKSWETKRAAAQRAYEALKLEPLPDSAEEAFALKNRLDAALAVRQLRILSNEVSVGAGVPAGRARPHAAPAEEEKLPKTWVQAPPYPTSAFKYSVTGSFRDMFLFLWTESARKTAYSLRDIRIANTDGGTMQMDFVLQVSHR